MYPFCHKIVRQRCKNPVSKIVEIAGHPPRGAKPTGSLQVQFGKIAAPGQGVLHRQQAVDQLPGLVGVGHAVLVYAGLRAGAADLVLAVKLPAVLVQKCTDWLPRGALYWAREISTGLPPSAGIKNCRKLVCWVVQSSQWTVTTYQPGRACTS